MFITHISHRHQKVLTLMFPLFSPFFSIFPPFLLNAQTPKAPIAKPTAKTLEDVPPESNHKKKFADFDPLQALQERIEKAKKVFV